MSDPLHGVAAAMRPVVVAAAGAAGAAAHAGRLQPAVPGHGRGAVRGGTAWLDGAVPAPVAKYGFGQRHFFVEQRLNKRFNYGQSIGQHNLFRNNNQRFGL